VCVSVTPQNLISTGWSATDHKARSVHVPQCVNCRNEGALQSSAHQMLHRVCSLLKEKRSCLSVKKQSRAFGVEFHKHGRAAVEEQLVGSRAGRASGGS